MNPTTCAVCSAALAHQAPAQSCRRCQTRLCGEACLKQHNKSRGECKKIQRAGGAEQIYANEQYAAAASVAIVTCAAEMAGEVCYICRDERLTEGLVRACVCRGTAGVVHLSCLIRQAQVSVDEANEYNLDGKRWMSKWERWYKCSQCGQEHRHHLAWALGWACWKTYVSRPESDKCRLNAIQNLGQALLEGSRDEEALSVFRTQEAFLRLRGENSLASDIQHYIAICLEKLGRFEDALVMKRQVLNFRLRSYGKSHIHTLMALNNLAGALKMSGKPWEAVRFLRIYIPIATSSMGPEHVLTIRMRKSLVKTIFTMHFTGVSDSNEELFEAQAIIEDLLPMTRRVFGDDHPETRGVEHMETGLLALLEEKAAPTGKFAGLYREAMMFGDEAVGAIRESRRDCGTSCTCVPVPPPSTSGRA